MSIFGSVTIRGNRITDVVQQTATVGIPIPFGYGKFVAQGNIIGNSELRERVIRRRQGKGGVKTEDYEYTIDYAIGFAEGPIYGYWTIKRQGKVVYSTDPAFPVEDQTYAAKWLQNVELYYGTEAQLPDPTLEAIYGVGQVSAMRGLAYIVVKNDNVTANQGAVPPYEAILVGNADLYLTSKPYPLEFIESMNSNAAITRGETLAPPLDEINSAAVLTGGELRDPLRTYVYLEELNSAARLDSGALVTPRDPLRSYTNWPAEEMNSAAWLTGGLLDDVLITYSRYQPEELNSAAFLTGGSLS